MFLVHFWGKKIFLENLALSCTTPYGFVAPCQNLEKVNDTITENAQRDRWKDGRKDGQTLFYRTLPATVEGPKINWMPGADLSHLPNNQGEKLEKLLEEEYKVFLKDENDIG